MYTYLFDDNSEASMNYNVCNISNKLKIAKVTNKIVEVLNNIFFI